MKPISEIETVSLITLFLEEVAILVTTDFSNNAYLLF